MPAMNSLPMSCSVMSAVDRKHDRRRDHDAERPARGDHAGRERLRIAVAAHLRIGDLEKVAAVATDEPQIAANPPQAAIVAMPSPPRRWPRNEFAARNSSRLMPEVVANAPISRNSGTTAKLIGHRAHRGVAEILNAGPPA